ncbi:CopG family transcriptional regulator [Thiobaca trueperi]|uniref:Ribbon-helix-helix CopG family protein n=1 Tax=Thiobaca trueperi TaxID=127458 RepID=A0A4V2V0Z3_9GAMM|nr:CopG family transcriptional regulator [Thiobaca trueperi]TCT19212.1 ribbon-helix-helix CopG family protein [Thiobaca trueperi]
MYIANGYIRMHFNIDLDDATGQQLNQLAKQAGETRNALIRKAVRAWMTQQAQPQWPQAILDFTGLPDTPAFESYRNALPHPAEDPLA